MARSKNGLFGLFIGKIGNLIFSIWKGKQISRVRPAHLHNPNTPAQNRERSKFKILTKFISENHEIFKIGFITFSKQMHTANAAYKYNCKTAVAGTYPNQYIDVTKLTLSYGKLLPLEELKATPALNNTITVNWTDNSFSNSKASAQDNVIISVFDETSGKSKTFFDAGRRGDETANLPLDSKWAGCSVSVYAFVVKDNVSGRSMKPIHISNSVAISGIAL